MMRNIYLFKQFMLENGIEYDVPQDIQKLDTTPPNDLKQG